MKIIYKNDSVPVFEMEENTSCYSGEHLGKNSKNRLERLLENDNMFESMNLYKPIIINRQQYFFGYTPGKPNEIGYYPGKFFSDNLKQIYDILRDFHYIETYRIFGKKEKDYSITLKVILFVGKIYFIANDSIFSKDDILKYYDNYISHRSLYKDLRKAFEEFSYISDKYIENIHLKFKSPLIMLEIYKDNKCLIVETNPVLEKSPGDMDDFSAALLVNQYYNSILLSSESDTIQISNNDKIIKAGHDPIKSFRNM